MTGYSGVYANPTGTTSRNVTKRSGSWGYEVALNMDYNKYTEFGTRYIPANPTLTVVYEKYLPITDRYIERIFDK